MTASFSDWPLHTESIKMENPPLNHFHTQALHVTQDNEDVANLLMSHLFLIAFIVVHQKCSEANTSWLKHTVKQDHV